MGLDGGVGLGSGSVKGFLEAMPKQVELETFDLGLPSGPDRCNNLSSVSGAGSRRS